MNFSIVTDTAGAKVSVLADELVDFLEDKINSRFKESDVSIGIAIRCLPEFYDRNSFIRYTKKVNYLTIDFCVLVEDYEEMYKIEQRFYLGQVFIQWLTKGLENKSFLKENPNFKKDEFMEYLIKLGQEKGWFVEEIDWSLELDK